MIEQGISKVISKHGASVLGGVCNVTPQAVRKWGKKGRLPRTEWTKETNYAELIAKFDPEFTKEELLKSIES